MFIKKPVYSYGIVKKTLEHNLAAMKLQLFQAEQLVDADHMALCYAKAKVEIIRDRVKRLEDSLNNLPIPGSQAADPVV